MYLSRIISCILWFAIFLFGKDLMAQAEVKFHRVKLQDPYINAITQDKYGFIWLGTPSGLMRYDGKSTKLFKPVEVDTLEHEHNTVSGLFIDSKKRLWLCTDTDGAFLFDLERETFKNLAAEKDNPKALRSNRVFQIMEDQQKNIWITAGGFFKLDEKTWTISERIAPKSRETREDSPSPFTNGIALQDRTGRFWMATWQDDVGVDTFRMGQQRFYHLPADRNKIDSPTNGPQAVRKIFMDKSGDVWFGTYRGLYWYNQKTGNFRSFVTDLKNNNGLSADNISDIVEDAEGNIWVGTLGGGLCKYDRKMDMFTSFTSNSNNINSIPDDNVSALFIDREGILWVGTSAGLAYLNPRVSKFHILKHKVRDFQDYSFGGRVIAETANGWIWSGLQKGADDLGAAYAGVVGQNPKTGDFVHYLPKYMHNMRLVESRLESVQEVAPNKLWLHFRDAEFVEYHEGKFKLVNDFQIDINLSPINFWLTADKRLFVNTYGLFSVIDKGQRRQRKLKNEPGTEDFTEMYIWEDPFKTIWYLNRVDTLYRYNEAIKDIERIAIPINKDYHDLRIAGAVMYEKDKMWIASYLGLQLIDLKTGAVLKTLGKSAGLPSDPAFSLNKDRNGFMWLTTSQGISRIAPTTYRVDNFYLERDLPVNLIYTTHHGRAIYAMGAHTGNIYIKTNEGVLFFDPAQINAVNNIANIVFSDLKVGDKSLKLDSLLTLKKIVELPPDADMVTIEFALLNYANSEFNTYSYQLVGFDKKVVDIAERNYATYANLPPGEYTFKVWAKNDKGLATSISKDLIIIKKPYFWQRLDFRIAVLLLVCGLLSFAVYWRIRELSRNQVRLEEKVAERTATVEKKSNEIIASINYAKRIQTAMLPQKEHYSRFVPPYWVVYKPKDIVSGDFYWVNEIKMGNTRRRVLIAAVDCTGHGVPGAMMAMMGHNLLDEITGTLEVFVPNLILDEMNKLIRKNLRQFDTENRDGMAISLVAMDMVLRAETQSIRCEAIFFAGAGQSMTYQAKNGELISIKGNVANVGGHERTAKMPFLLHEVPLRLETIYLFSDGFQDQFGGPQNKRYSKKQLVQFISTLHNLKPEEKIDKLYAEHENWQKQSVELQTDDVLVMGIELKDYLAYTNWA